MPGAMSNRSLFALLLLGLCGVAFAGLLAGCDPVTLDDYSPPAPVKKADQPLPDMAQPPPPPDLSPVPDLVQLPDLTCGAQQFQLERIPPNVMLVLDRSGSMGQSIDGASATKKWDDLKVALGQLVTNYDTLVRFGVSLYSADGDCLPGNIDSAPADKNGMNVLGKVNAASPGGNTPTAGTLAAVLASGAVSDATRQDVVVLATDGIPNCADTDVEGKIQALYNVNVKTYVIGVGTGTASNPDLLNAWAVAGHTDRAGTTKYYQTNSQADLKAAFDAIALGLVSCTFKMSAPVPDPNQVYVFDNGVPVPNDPVDGFTYDAMGPTVTLNGAACAALKANPMNDVKVQYGCAIPPPVP
jgi:von Willebrand factor type A domain